MYMFLETQFNTFIVVKVVLKLRSQFCEFSKIG